MQDEREMQQEKQRESAIRQARMKVTLISHNACTKHYNSEVTESVAIIITNSLTFRYSQTRLYIVSPISQALLVIQ